MTRASIRQSSGPARAEITRLLAGRTPDAEPVVNDLIPLVYAELRRIARRQLHRLRPGDTLGTTGLIHEAYLKLVDQKQLRWQDRNHFFAITACAMRQALVNYAVHKQADKREGAAAAVPLDEAASAMAEPAALLLELDMALKRLEQLEPRLCRVVECRFFAGFTEEETAEFLGVSVRTVQRDWKLARAWLHEELAVAG